MTTPILCRRKVGHERKLDGAFTLGLYEGVGEVGLSIEMYLIESWHKLMFVRERVTKGDRDLEDHFHLLLATLPDIKALDCLPTPS